MTMTLRELVSAVLAAVFVLTFCAIVLFDALNSKPYSVPDAFLAIVVSVVSYFFGQHAATNGAYAAGVVAGQSVVNALVPTPTVPPVKP